MSDRSKTSSRHLKPVPFKQDSPASSLPGDLIMALAIFVTTLIAYLPAAGFEFLSYDDRMYVTGNLHVQGGLHFAGIVWAFTTLDASNWHPLTWLSLMLDVSMAGVQPAVFHVTNLLLHALNAAILFMVFLRLTGSRWRSALVAALFALHPLHIESVAWIAERKDVLSTFFGLLTIWAYTRFVQRRTVLRYAGTAALFALSLLSKSMLVTLPCVLLLLDFWPLRRWRGWRVEHPDQQLAGHDSSGAILILEKLPLMLLSIGCASVTILAQRQGGAMKMLEPIAFSDRLANAVVSYALYLRDAIWPAHLAVLYPHPGTWPAATVWISAAILALITAVSIWQIKRMPHLLVGWLWYLGTLVPVIGLVQIGEQSRADRYTYVPLIGIFIMTAWSIPGLRHAARWPRTALTATALAVLIALTIRTQFQLPYWRDSRTLFSHALAVNERNATAHSNLGNEIARSGDLDAALKHYERAVEINPNVAEAHSGIGDVHFARNEYDQARVEYAKALEINDRLAAAHSGLGAVEAHDQHWDAAIKHFERVLQLAPATKNLALNLGVLYASGGRPADAIAMYVQALKGDPNRADIWANLAAAYAALQEYPQAIEAARSAERLALAAGDQKFAATMQNLMDEYQRRSAAGVLQPGK